MTTQQTPQKRRITVIPPNPQLTERDIHKKHLRVAPYCRVSTDSEEQLNSYNAQIAYYTEKIAATPEWTMVRLYADEGITGELTPIAGAASKGERPRPVSGRLCPPKGRVASAPHREGKTRCWPPCGPVRPPPVITAKHQKRGPQGIPYSRDVLGAAFFVSPEGGDQKLRNKTMPQISASQTRRWRPLRTQICRICWNTWATASGG